MTPAELILTLSAKLAELDHEAFLLAYQDDLPCEGILPRLGHFLRYPLDRDVYSCK